MDTKLARMIWMLAEKEVYKAANDPSYEEHHFPQGESVSADAPCGWHVSVEDCMVMDAAVICIRKGDEVITKITAGEDAWIYGEADCVLEKRPQWHELEDPVWDHFDSHILCYLSTFPNPPYRLEHCRIPSYPPVW